MSAMLEILKEYIKEYKDGDNSVTWRLQKR